MQEQQIHSILEQFKASAGSGKTFTLTSRFLDMMRRRGGGDTSRACGGAGAQAAWPEIMAVTFTNKAAAQMKEKVVAALKARALGLEEPPQAKDWNREEAAQKLDMILRHYHRLNIRTIDSLLHLIVRVFALPLELNPDFEVVFDLNEILDPLLDETIALAAREGSVERRLLENAVASLLFLEETPGFMPANGIKPRLAKVVNRLLMNPAEPENDAAELGERIHASAEVFRRAAADMARIIEEEGLSANSRFLDFLNKAAEFGSGGKPPGSTYAAKPCLDECLLKASRGACSHEAEKRYLELCRAYADYHSVYVNLAGARNIAAFVDLARYMIDRIHDYQRRFGIMLNHTWPELAVTALSGETGVPDAFCRLGARISSLLIDEFQDTSRLQWEALKPLAVESLATGGRLFIVGDIKQAIYGWRGGEALLFDEVVRDGELRAMAEFRPERLEYNWRSLDCIVGFNNRVFCRLQDPAFAARVAAAMIGEDSAGLTRLSGSVAAAFAEARQENPPKKDNSGGYVQITRIRGENKEELYDNVREALQDVLRYDLLERRRPGDIAVLVRSNDEAARVSQWLIDWGAPVVTENSLRLDEHPLVREMLSALHFLDYPLDDAAFFEFVSGGRMLHPIGGPGRETLFSWIASGAGHGPLYRRFSKDFPEAWEKLIAPFVRRSGLMGPYDTVRELVRAYDLLERFPDDEAFLRRFLEVVFAAEQSGRLSISSFLEYWRDSGPEEKVPLPENLDAVRVLTIHKAKGLEFPAVVVPFHHWPNISRDAMAVTRFEGKRLLTPLKKDMGETYDHEIAPMLQEQLHLLYVAWTRPREELYCMLTGTSHYDGYPICKALEILVEDLDFDEDEYGRPTYRDGRPPDLPAPPAREPRRPEPRPEPEPRTVAEPMSWLPRLKIHRNLSLDLARDELLVTGPLFDERARGTIFHEALDMAAARGGAMEPAAAVSAARAACSMPIPEKAVSELEQALRWVLEHDELSAYLAAGVPEASIMDEGGKLHRPDLLARGYFGTCVLEYKTGSEQNEHPAQVRRYMNLLAAMEEFPKPIFGVIAYLDLKRLVRVEAE